MDSWQTCCDDMIGTIRGHMRASAAQTGVATLSPHVEQAMRTVPRHHFVPPWNRHMAYADMPLSIGHGQTISQPFIVALMSELLGLQGDERVLEVGTGCGYQTAVLARLADRPAAVVDSVECIAGLAVDAHRHLHELGLTGRVHLHVGNGWQGWAESAPFDAIMVTAAAVRIPDQLAAQLAPGGRMVIPVGPAGSAQQLLRVEKSLHGELVVRNTLAVVFVPLLENP